MRKPCQLPGRMKNSSYYIAPVRDRTHDLPHTVASNMVKVSHALNHSATDLQTEDRCSIFHLDEDTYNLYSTMYKILEKLDDIDTLSKA